MEKPETDEVDKYLKKNLVLRENMLGSLSTIRLMLHMLMVNTDCTETRLLYWIFLKDDDVKIQNFSIMGIKIRSQN